MNSTVEPPDFADPLYERFAALGRVVATSATGLEDAPDAWAIACEFDDGYLIGAIADTLEEDSAEEALIPVVALRVRKKSEVAAAMAMARSLVHRNGARVLAGGLCSLDFEDVSGLGAPGVPVDAAVPFSVRAPQFSIAPAKDWGIELPEVSLAVAATWPEMALEPSLRASAVKTRATAGISGAVMEPLDGAIDGMFRALRKGKDPLLSSAGFAVQSLISDSELKEANREEVKKRLTAFACAEKITEERAEVLGALVDTFNGHVLANTPFSSAALVLCQLRLPDQDIVAYFYDGARARPVRLEARHPEKPLAPDVVAAGFALLTEVFRKHRAVVQKALGAEGGFELRRGFHPNASLAAVEASFRADGFQPIVLIFDR